MPNHETNTGPVQVSKRGKPQRRCVATRTGAFWRTTTPVDFVMFGEDGCKFTAKGKAVKHQTKP